MFVRSLFSIIASILLCVSVQSCSPSITDEGDKNVGTTEVLKPVLSPEENEEEKEGVATTAPITEVSETVEEKKEEVITPVLTTLESKLKFIREKFAMINETKDYKTVSYSVVCDHGESKYERKTNEEKEVVYLKTVSCGDHGCRATEHYFWDDELIFIYTKDSYFAGRSDFLVEYRTYFKNGEMIQCLEKEVQTVNGQDDLEKLSAKAANKKVACTPEKLTKELDKMKTFTEATATSYFCDY